MNHVKRFKRSTTLNFNIIGLIKHTTYIHTNQTNTHTHRDRTHQNTFITIGGEWGWRGKRGGRIRDESERKKEKRKKNPYFSSNFQDFIVLLRLLLLVYNVLIRYRFVFDKTTAQNETPSSFFSS